MSDKKVDQLTIEVDPADFKNIVNSVLKEPVLKVQFNPQTFDYTWKVNWSNQDTQGNALNTLQFQNVEKRNLTLNLIFDLREYNLLQSASGKLKSVRDLTRKFELLAKPIVGKAADPASRPPFITVIWGGSIQRIRGVLSSFGQQYILFSREGVPLRARVTLVVQEYVDAATQLKEFQNGDPEQFLLVRHGDTLPAIAHREYGDAARWRIIADANNLADTRNLKEGTRLFLPALDSVKT